ncbi:hypothetical protein [Salinibacter altiplanensis]|uniref:hypothetical protein n=1 Tax=Salinibacter altiplanensis TaxID=1803181 RepID=UPI0012FFFC52|nr:hypothetical protein [Salinibacter altiplanensis]
MSVPSFLFVPRGVGSLPLVLLAVVLASGCDSRGPISEEQGDSVPKVAAGDISCTVVEPFGAAASQFDYSDSLVTSVSEIVPAQMEIGGSVPDGHVVTGLSASAADKDGGVEIQALHLQHREVFRDGSLGPRARIIFAIRTAENCEAPPDLDDPFPQVPDGHVAAGVAVHMENSPHVQSIDLSSRSIGKQDGALRLRGAADDTTFGLRRQRRDFDDVAVVAPGDRVLTGLALRATNTGGFNARRKIKHIGLEYARLNPDF